MTRNNRNSASGTLDLHRAIDYSLVVTALFVFFLPPLAFDRIPTQDGPLHVDTAAAMVSSTGLYRHFFERYVEFHFSFDTNTLGHNVLALLLRFSNDPVEAERIFQILYCALYSSGLLYFLTAVRTSAWRLLPLGLPFAFSYLFHLGFYNNCLSYVGLLWCWGALLRCNRQASFANVISLALSLLLTWMAHPIGSVAFSTGAIFYLSLRFFAGQDGTRGRTTSLLLLSAAPLGAQMIFVQQTGGGAAMSFNSWGELVDLLLRLTAMDSFGKHDLEIPLRTISIVFAELLLVTYGAALLQRSRATSILALPLFYLALYFLAPAQASGSSYINERLMPLIFLLIVAAVASISFSRTVETALATAGLLFVIGVHAVHWPVYRQQSRVENDYLFARATIQPEKFVYAMHLASHAFDGRSYASQRADSTTHLAGFYTAGHSAIYLGNTIGRWQEGRQISFRSEIMSGMSGLPPAFPGTLVPVDFEKFTEAVGRPIDYVLIYGDFRSEGSKARHYEELTRQHYRCDLVSPLGLVKLCERND